MSQPVATSAILLVTGMSGAGKSTVLKTLEDLGWEVVDNLPLALLEALLAAPVERRRSAAAPLAVGIDSRTRGFDAGPHRQTDQGAARRPADATCRHCSSTARAPSSNAAIPRPGAAIRWPLDRPATDGIARERELTGAAAALGRTCHRHHRLQQPTSCSRRCASASAATGWDEPMLTSCRSASPAACRATPTWCSTCASCAIRIGMDELRPGTGLDPTCRDYIAGDPAYEATRSRQIEDTAARAAPALSRRRKILCHHRFRLHRRTPPVGPCRRTCRETVARGGFFAHGDPPRPRLAAAGRA